MASGTTATNQSRPSDPHEAFFDGREERRVVQNIFDSDEEKMAEEDLRCKRTAVTNLFARRWPEGIREYFKGGKNLNGATL